MIVREYNDLITIKEALQCAGHIQVLSLPITDNGYASTCGKTLPHMELAKIHICSNITFPFAKKMSSFILQKTTHKPQTSKKQS